MWYIHPMRYYAAIKRNKVLNGPDCSMDGKECQVDETAMGYRIPFMIDLSSSFADSVFVNSVQFVCNPASARRALSQSFADVHRLPTHVPDEAK